MTEDSTTTADTADAAPDTADAAPDSETEGPDCGRPFSEFQTLIEDVVSGVRDLPSVMGVGWSKMDVVQAPDEYLYFIDLPGVEREDLELTARGSEIVVKATRNAPDLPADAVKIRSERTAGPFRKTIRLPMDADPGSVQARLKKGVLRVRVSRISEDAATTIKLDD